MRTPLQHLTGLLLTVVRDHHVCNVSTGHHDTVQMALFVSQQGSGTLKVNLVATPVLGIYRTHGMVYSLDVNNTRTGNGGVCVQVDIAHRGPIGVLGLLGNQSLAVFNEVRLTGLVVDVKQGTLTIKEDHIYQGGVEDGLVSQGGALGLFYALLLFCDVALCAQDLYGESAFTLAQD